MIGKRDEAKLLAGGQRPIPLLARCTQAQAGFCSNAARVSISPPMCRMFTLLQTGRMKLDPKGGWKHTDAVQVRVEHRRAGTKAYNGRGCHQCFRSLLPSPCRSLVVRAAARS